MKKVDIVLCKNTYSHHSDRVFELKVYVDGERIGGGSYGGEPEDNSHYRNYAWVQELVINLAGSLNSSVTVSTEQYDN